jgi:hypothetical protein
MPHHASHGRRCGRSQVVPPALLAPAQAPRHVERGADHGAAGSGRRTTSIGVTNIIYSIRSVAS